MAAIRRPVRSRPIRLFLISMFAVPLVSLVGLWAFAASVTVPSAISAHHYDVNSVALTGPAISTLTLDLPTEQQQTYLWLLSGRQAPKASLLATRNAISKALPGAEAALLTDENLLSAPSEHFRPGPEHRRIPGLCRRPMPIVDLTSEIDLPLGVVRVLLGDLAGEGMLRIVSAQREPLPDQRLLRMVLDGLESL